MAKKYASQVVELAKSWIGKKESNRTHEEIIDIYNGHKPLARGYRVKYTDEWCATTVSAIAIKLGYTDIIPTECGCGQMIELFKKLGCWAENENRTPKAGEVIFYDWQDSGKGDNKGWPDHVGIVEKVVNGVITVIEGNYNQAVKRRTIKMNAKNIRGYGVPKYDAEPNKTTASYYKKYTGQSGKIDEVFKAIGVSSKYIKDKSTETYAVRKPVAAKNGISNYRGTYAQNTKLITLAKNGKLKKI